MLWTRSQNLSPEGFALDVLSFTKTLFTGESEWKRQFEDIRSDVPNHNIWEAVLSRHVSDQGHVDYVSLKNDGDQLQMYLDHISNHPPHSGWSTSENLAYWINAYNAFTIRLILDHYPIQTIKEIAGGIPMYNSPWDIEFFKIGGLDFSLNYIEHEILRKEFREPRIHFALNCASESCPILANYAYIPEKLESQLETQTIAFLMDSTKNIIDGNQLKLSPIFKWYSADFGNKEDLIKLIEKSIDFDINNNYKLEYLEYDWSLNSQ